MHPRIIEFIEALPPPDAIFSCRDSKRVIMKACKQLIETSNEWYRSFADGVRIPLYALAVAGMGREPWEFASQLGAFCISQERHLQGGSAAARKLQNYLWTATGMWDENNPAFSGLNIAAATGPQAGEGLVENQLYRRGPHEFLPNNPDTYRICAFCNTSGANLRCRDCLDDFDLEICSTFMIYYCNEDCQRSHKAKYNNIHRGRKCIFRATAILQDLFLAYKEELYTELLEDVSEDDGILVLRHGDLAKAVSAGQMIFRPFPRDLTPSEEQLILALLWGQSDDVMLNFKSILENILGPICRTIGFVLYRPKNVNIPTKRLIHDDATSGPKVQNLMFHTHTVIKATLYSGEKVAIDLAAGQFGWREAVAPWAHWCRCRAIGLSKEHPLYKAQDRAAQSSLSGNRLARAGAQAAPQMLRHMMFSEVLLEMRCCGFTYMDLLHELTPRDFGAIHRASYDAALHVLQNKRQLMRGHGHGQMSFSPNGSSIFLTGYLPYIFELPAKVVGSLEPHVPYNQELYSLPFLRRNSDREEEEEEEDDDEDDDEEDDDDEDEDEEGSAWIFQVASSSRP